jgi:phosphatidylglycerol:prolipoprotein diacylglycerol transferase
MLTYPQFDPIALSLGPIAIRWYGLMYVVAFVLFVVLGRLHLKRRPDISITNEQLDDLLFFGMLGVILGGRLGYVMFYKAGHYLSHPLEVFYIWQGGMSFHGGFLGVVVAMMLWGRKIGHGFWRVADFVAPLVPLGYAAGRLGNFINGELPGRITDHTQWPWAMWFQHVDATPLARHPSSLYQFFAEGLVLFALLWWYSKRPRPVGCVAAMFLVGYGALRFLTEFARQPDDFLGFLALGFSMGQWLSLPMVLVGIGLFVFFSRRSAANPA